MANLEWLISIIPSRLKIITEDLRTVVISDWRPDFTPESLLGVGHWMKAKAEYRELSMAEKEAKIKAEGISGLSALMTREMTHVLTNETEARSFDLSIYFAETLINTVKFASWSIELRKSYADFHKPIVIKLQQKAKAYMPLNPQAIATTFTYNVLLHDSQPEQLQRFFNVWHKNFS